MSEPSTIFIKVLRERLTDSRTYLWMGIAVLVHLMLKMHAAIMTYFHFKTTDMDQVLMWYGLDEMRKGNFHMPRYYGQDYGSMLEPFLAIPFTGVDYDILLPYVAYGVLLVPYILMIVLGTNGKFFALASALSAVCFLGAMPTEYLMVGVMPKDMATGVAVTSLGLLFLRNEKWYGLFLVGFFSLLGWSVNSNAALFGAVLTLYTLFSNQGMTLLKRGLYIGLGYAVVTVMHVMLNVYLHNSGMIVHSHWELVFQFGLIASAFENLDSHWGHIAVLFHARGWIYLVLFVLLLIVAKVQKNKAVFIAALALTLITCLSLGVNKIHDGTSSVFFSLSRMYMALPVACLFLLTKLNINTKLYMPLIPLIATLLIIQTGKAKFKADEQVMFVNNTVITISDIKDLKNGCKEIEEIWIDTKAQAILFGPGKLHEAWSFSRACPCLTEIELMVRPEYERKTWDLIQLDADTFSQFLWFSTESVETLSAGIGKASITKLDSITYFKNIYLVQGANLNPMQIYKDAGFESVKYK